MCTKNKKRKEKNLVRHLTIVEYKAISFVSTMILAGITISHGIKDPVVWTFLGTAIGVLLGQASPTSANQ